MSKLHDPMESEEESRKSAGMPGLRHTVWDQQDIKLEYPKITKDESADVVIVGAGIFGLSTAYNLVKEGKKVVVLEAKARG
jgi:NADPH-dependent 2,4-dienoyl-CoA reductase/sulfur reductase-like enzyme